MRTARATFAVDHPRLVIQVTDDGSRTLLDPVTNVAFHSGSGAVAETRHVYLDNSGVADRLADRVATKVLEIGLGTGMGLLLTIDAATLHSAPIEYTAVEHDWLAADLLGDLEIHRHLENASLAERFLQWRASLGKEASPGVHRWQVGPDQSVTVQVTDARQFASADRSKYDAIYFDPFAPQANPELWQIEFLTLMLGLLTDEGRLVTYCVSRTVREAFNSAGFRVTRVRGPKGGKREVMIATKF